MTFTPSTFSRFSAKQLFSGSTAASLSLSIFLGLALSTSASAQTQQQQAQQQQQDETPPKISHTEPIVKARLTTATKTNPRTYLQGWFAGNPKPKLIVEVTAKREPNHRHIMEEALLFVMYSGIVVLCV